MSSACSVENHSNNDVQRITILGSTGSIGLSTLDVISRHSDRFSVFALTANTNVDVLYEQCQKFRPVYAVLADHDAALRLQQRLADGECKTEVLAGEKALAQVAGHSDTDTVMAAIVGAAGLLPTMSAVRSSKKVLLANKESLVMAGRLFMDAVAESGAQLLPIDSEHNAIFQCLPPASLGKHNEIRKILLTGSGGPFRTWNTDDIRKATPDQACKHPNWSMGRKISVDSASLMNKGLEFIEAKWLFGVEPSAINVVIHPQSVIHSMVEYIDGSVLAQLGNPDMRIPIAHGLAYPERIESGVASLDIIAAAQLDFESPNYQDFPALSLAIEAAGSGIGAATILNAANEVAVEKFLNHSISFGQMNDVLQAVMSQASWDEPQSLDEVVAVDHYSRRVAAQVIGTLC